MNSVFKPAPQEIRTFFVSTRTNLSKPLFRNERFACLMLDVIRDNREKRRMFVHEFVVMPEHLHVLLTPASDQSLEKCMQFLKGGFSFRVKKELEYRWNVWQESFNEHRVKDAADFWGHAKYIHQNPVEAGLVKNTREYKFSSAGRRDLVDEAPEQFRG